MDLADELRLLKSQILTPGAGRQAFQTWSDIKDRLSASQRVRILTAWNNYLRTKNENLVIETFEQITASVDP